MGKKSVSYKASIQKKWESLLTHSFSSIQVSLQLRYHFHLHPVASIQAFPHIQNHHHSRSDIFSKEINIVDDPLIKRGIGSQCFDSEGVKNNKLNLVNKGIFNELILDTYYSKILKMETNGRSGGTTNLYIEKNPKIFQK